MTETTTRNAAPSRAMNVTVWVLQVLAALAFLYSGEQKVTAEPMQVAGFQQMGLGVTGMYVIGMLELAAGLGLLLPGIAGFAAVCLVGLMTGAVIVTVQMMGLVPLAAIPVVTLVIVAVIAWVRRHRAAAFVRFALGR